MQIEKLKNRRVALPFIVSLLFLLVSCSEPDANCAYHKVNPKNFDTRDTISFEMELSKEEGPYNLYVGARFPQNSSESKLPITFNLISPSGKLYREDVVFPCNDMVIKRYLKEHSDSCDIKVLKSGKYTDIQWCWRKNVIPEESGRWKLHFFLPYSKIYGIGIYREKADERKR